MQTQGGGTILTRKTFWLVAAATLILDLASKNIVFYLLGGPQDAFGQTAGGEAWLLPHALRIVCHYNTGGAFGWMSGNTLIFLTATVILIPVLVLMAYQCQAMNAPLWALGMIVGGAIGNMYDRLIHIGVRDFIELVNPSSGLPLWPVFNIADVAIVAGVIIYLGWSFLASPKKA